MGSRAQGRLDTLVVLRLLIWKVGTDWGDLQTGQKTAGLLLPQGAVGKRLYPPYLLEQGFHLKALLEALPIFVLQQIGISSPSHFIAQHNNTPFIPWRLSR